MAGIRRCTAGRGARSAITDVALEVKVLFTSPTILMAHYFNFFGLPIGYQPVNDLFKKRVSLYCMSHRTQCAYLVDFDDGLDQFDTTQHPLLHYSQRTLAKQLYVVPLEVFYRLSDGVDISSRRIVWMNHHGRCGSTVWSQIFNDLPEWGVVSETHYLINTMIFDFRERDIHVLVSSPDFIRMAVAGFKYYVGTFPSNYSVFIKTNLHELWLLQCVPQALPNVKLLYMYRNVAATAQSWYSAISDTYHSTEMEEIFTRTKNISVYGDEYLVRFCMQKFTSSDPTALELAEEVGMRDQYEWYVMTWSAINQRVQRLLGNGMNMKCIKYEDMTSDMRSVIHSVFKHLKIDDELVPIAVSATKRNSQAGHSYTKRDKKDTTWRGDKIAVDRCNQILRHFGFGSLNSRFYLPNTLE